MVQSGRGSRTPRGLKEKMFKVVEVDEQEDEPRQPRICNEETGEVFAVSISIGLSISTSIRSKYKAAFTPKTPVYIL